jgi:hypothetical protein
MFQTPDQAERDSLSFLVAGMRFSWRYLLAFACFASGIALAALVPGSAWVAGLALVMAGHLPLWVMGPYLEPAAPMTGGDPVDWVSVGATGTTATADPVGSFEEDWVDKARRLVAQGAAWDRSTLDISNLLGGLVFGLTAVVALLFWAGTSLIFGHEAMTRLLWIVVALVLPLFFNGMRRTWKPANLLLRGETLKVARNAVLTRRKGGWIADSVLGMKQGSKGRYPTDARLMIRPVLAEGEADDGFIGVQVQVALNTVQGKVYPYLYAVVLAKKSFRMPIPPATYVVEPGESDDVRFLVVRQAADRKGGWYTPPGVVQTLVDDALDMAEALRGGRV